MPFVSNTAGLVVPDIYVNEIEPPVQLIGKATGIVAFAAQFERGPLNESISVSDPSDLIRKFGRFTAGLDGFMFALNMLKQGANNLKIVRIADSGAVESHLYVSGATSATALFTLTALDPGTYGNDLTLTVAASTVSGFVDVEIAFENEVTKYTTVNFTVGDTNYLIDKINQDSNRLVDAARTAASGVTTLPDVQSDTAFTGGLNGTLTGTSLVDSYYVGADAASGKSGTVVFEADDEVNILCSPRHTDTVNTAIIAQAENQNVSPRMAVISVPYGTSIASLKVSMATINSDFVIMTYPFVKIYNTYTKVSEFHSPVALYCGLLGTLSPHVSQSRKQFFGVLGMERDLTRAEVESLTNYRVSPVTKLNGQGFVVRNGITTSSNGGKRQTVRRRMVNYLAITLEGGLQPFVSRPHTSSLRNEIKTSINGFLERELRDGRIGNANGGKAYGVKCDRRKQPGSRGSSK